MQKVAELENRDLEKIYEYTYKLGMLKAEEDALGGYLPDRIYNYKALVAGELESVLTPAYDEMLNTYENWLYLHSQEGFKNTYLEQSDYGEVGLADNLAELHDRFNLPLDHIYDIIIAHLGGDKKMLEQEDETYLGETWGPEYLESLKNKKSKQYKKIYNEYKKLVEEGVYDDIAAPRIIEENNLKNNLIDYILKRDWTGKEWLSELYPSIKDILSVFEDIIIENYSSLLDTAYAYYLDTFSEAGIAGGKSLVENIEDIKLGYESLKEFENANLPEKIVAFQYGLTVAHHYGTMADHLLGVQRGFGEVVLDKLSSTTKVEEWNADLVEVLRHQPGELRKDTGVLWIDPEEYRKEAGEEPIIELMFADEILEGEGFINNDPWALANSSDIRISSNKEFFCGHVHTNSEDGKLLVSALFIGSDPESFSFDTVVHSLYRGFLLGPELTDVAIQEFHNIQEAYPDIKLELEVVNPQVVDFLKRKYDLEVLKDLGNTKIMGSLLKTLEILEEYEKDSCKRQAMPFVPKPDLPSHEIDYIGTSKYPGFHTTSSYENASFYALNRVVESFTEEENGVHYTTDYPVIVALDMSGLEKKVDYDAVQYTLETLKVHLNELKKELNENSTDEEINSAIQAFLDGIDFQEGSASYFSGVGHPFAYITEEAWTFRDPLSNVVDNPALPEAIRQYLITGKWDNDSLLMEMAQQYRYTEEVTEDRIRAVYYLMPIAEDVTTMEDDEDDTTLEKRWPGFDILFEDDILNRSFSPRATLVWGELPDNVEYHGTTYKRLLSAAPSLENALPPPPSPPFVG
jgi:hypothetical protein